MPNAARPALLLSAAVFTACSSGPKPLEPALPAGHNFAYETLNREHVNLIQAFDDGFSTYLQFRDAPSPALEIRTVPAETRVTATANQRFLVLPGTYAMLRLTQAGASTTVINLNLPSSAAPAAAVAERSADHADAARNSLKDQVQEPTRAWGEDSGGTSASLANSARPLVPVGVPESLQTMQANLRVKAVRQEIASLEERIRQLSADLAAAHRTGRGSRLYLRELGPVPRVVVTFDNNSADALMDDDLAGSLGGTARAANRIYLHGHTDAFVASEAGTALAIARAVAVRQLLVSLAVEPERIRLFYRGAGNFVANNSTAEGKALNRRVEIELRRW